MADFLITNDSIQTVFLLYLSQYSVLYLHTASQLLHEKVGIT